jgi:hypothetical protein
LVTPTAYVGSATYVACKLINVSSATIPAQLQMLNSTGTVLEDTGPVTVGAGHLVGLSHFAPTDDVYCRFVKASKSKVRASLNIYTFADDTTDHTVLAAQ